MQFQAITIPPGDTLVVSVSAQLTRPQRETVEAYFRERLNVQDVLVLDGGAQLGVVHRLKQWDQV